jgi:hypothetical protein
MNINSSDISTTISLANLGFNLFTHFKAPLTKGAIENISKFMMLSACPPEHTAFFLTEAAKKWQLIPAEDRTPPDNRIVFDCLQYSCLVRDVPIFQEMFQELLVKNCNKQYANEVLPSFPFLLKQMSKTQATMIKNLHSNNGVLPYIFFSHTCLDNDIQFWIHDDLDCNDSNVILNLIDLRRSSLIYSPHGTGFSGYFLYDETYTGIDIVGSKQHHEWIDWYKNELVKIRKGKPKDSDKFGFKYSYFSLAPIGQVFAKMALEI